jgi:hypothetical protein
MLPVVLVALLFVVQFGLTYYARQVLAGAVQDGAAASARLDASLGDGEVLAESLIGEAGSALLDSYDVTVASDGEVVTMAATGEVVSLLPFFGSLTVEASASARIETFDGQGAP